MPRRMRQAPSFPIADVVLIAGRDQRRAQARLGHNPYVERLFLEYDGSLQRRHARLVERLPDEIEVVLVREFPV